jgi:hypothetical protein
MSIKWVCVVLVLLILLVPLSLVKAEESTEPFNVYTNKQDYIVGEPIDIYVKANALEPNQTITVADIIVYDPTNSSFAEWHDLSIVLTSTTTIHVATLIATTEGTYTVNATAVLDAPSTIMGNGGGTFVQSGLPPRLGWILRAIWRFFCRFWRPNVIPEYPFGTIVATVAFLGATGLHLARKRIKN